MPRKSQEIVEVNPQQLEQLLERASSNRLSEEDTKLLGQFFESYMHFFQVVGDKNTTIARLRRMLFGHSTEKSDNILDDDGEGETLDPTDSDDAPSDSTDLDDDTTSDDSTVADDDTATDDEPPPSPPGHGRYGADDYPGAEQADIKHASLCAGDDCPECTEGTVYLQPPSVFVRFKGQPPCQATVYRLQRFRCCLCGKVFTASAPDAMGDQKYDHTAASMIGLLKYGSGLPFNRLQRLQASFKTPLAASTQWNIVSTAATLMIPAYKELIRQAAQGDVVYNDDTTIKILELMGLRADKSPPTDDPHDPDRSGLFTSGVVSTRGGLRIALFFSGRRHAGENLLDVLKHRADQLDAPIQMCDGLARNLPKELETILSNCLAHGRRKFVELDDRFPDECRHVIRAFKVVYRNDKAVRQQGMSNEQRLEYHQTHSKPTMDSLKEWLERQFDEKLVEPNSALGDAINYMLRRWDSLTLFLRKAGAPLDNNVCERALKKSILHRKNSMFYKTRNGARVGDMYMSLIYTCELGGVNAFDYLNQLQLNASEVAEHPEHWMPWNYHENVATPACVA